MARKIVVIALLCAALLLLRTRGRSVEQEPRAAGQMRALPSFSSYSTPPAPPDPAKPGGGAHRGETGSEPGDDGELAPAAPPLVQITAAGAQGAGAAPADHEDLGDVARADVQAAKALAALQPTGTPAAAPTLADEEFEFTPQELAQLGAAPSPVKEGSGGDGLIPGIGSGFGVAGDSSLMPGIAEETPAPTPTPEPLAHPRYTGQARGYAMLYMMHPAARAAVERELQTLIDADVREVYLGILTDGTFGKDFDYVARVLRRLHAERRIVTLGLYLTNGATMRSHDTTPITAAFNQIDPFEFRSLIRWDPATRERFSAMVREVRPLFELNAALHPENRNIAVVMLEDNLQADSYAAMRALAAAVLGDLVEFVRNPCPGCLKGNDMESLGDGLELHNAGEMWRLAPGDGFTLDGTGHYFPWESPAGQALSYDQTLQLARAAYDIALSYFGLWRAPRQGLTSSAGVHPDLRSYEVPTAEQTQLEVRILQEGLELIEAEMLEGDLLTE